MQIECIFKSRSEYCKDYKTGDPVHPSPVESGQARTCNDWSGAVGTGQDRGRITREVRCPSDSGPAGPLRVSKDRVVAFADVLPFLKASRMHLVGMHQYNQLLPRQ